MTVGPAFKYQEANILDLKLAGKQIPATVGEGDKFRFVAEVGEFNPPSASSSSTRSRRKSVAKRWA